MPRESSEYLICRSELSAIQALRATLRSAFAGLPPADLAARLERDMALMQIPELWAVNLRLVTVPVDPGQPGHPDARCSLLSSALEKAQSPARLDDLE
jgi:hypothetical protein